MIPAIERLIHFYLNERLAPSETFLECYRRLGLGPFKRPFTKPNNQRCVPMLPSEKQLLVNDLNNQFRHHGATHVIDAC